jgi:hypothetical protein
VALDQWLPQDIDPERPTAARIYDYILGGAHNFAADRRVAEQMLAMDPDAPKTAYANRAFLRRAVEYLVGSGIRQFLDIGSGLPTVGHVHEVAQVAAPDARVLYVDIDPIAVTHSEHILAENDRAAVIEGDVRRPERILAAPETQRLLDLEHPVAVLVVALFHLISDEDDPADIVVKLTAPLASGSYLVISHLSGDAPQDMEKYADIFRRAGIEMTLRSDEQIAALFGEWPLIEPGLVWVPSWRPDIPDDVGGDPASSAIYGGVARKP